MRKMKNSGVEWIGEIPEEWETKRLKVLFHERKEKNDPVKTNFILSLGAAYGVVPYNEKEGGGNKAKENLTDYRLAYENDTYSELKKNLPKLGSVVETPMGSGKVSSVNVLKNTYSVDLKEKGIVEFNGENNESTK